MSNFLISCGGTGGHLSPGLAVGEALIKDGHKVSFIISQKAVDSKLVKKYADFEFEKVPGCGLSLKPKKLAEFFASQIRAVKECTKLIKDKKADAAIAFGGFNSFGLAVAAILAKKPLILHEANRKAGKAVRFFGRFAKRVYLPYGVKISKGDSEKIRQAGYPIRSEIKKLNEAESKKFFGFSQNANVILVCGGSQGASALNKWAVQNFAKLAECGFDILCITGSGKDEKFPESVTDKNGILREFKALDFCENMAQAMSCASVVVARAGAGSIAEFARCKVIPILVPFPFSADNHQLENARFVERSGAGICVMQENIASLKNEILEIDSNCELKAKMLKNLELIDNMNCISKLVSDIEQIASNREL